jgi:aryl-alcohol dehydrogenase-like predicted oxidoreductase
MTNLVLGGHSFIQQLGTDPAPEPNQATAIVAACLDSGVVRFDTTYAPERVALGNALKTLGRREEAFILAWNFFRHFGPHDPDADIGDNEAYRPEHLQRMLDELQTDWIDLLIVHPVDDPREQARQEELALGWLGQGTVRQVGTWAPDLATTSTGSYSAVVAPYNIATPNRAAAFAAYVERGWQTYAVSPFVRGWELERRAAASGLPISELADLMLRYSAFAANVQYLIVSMRKVEWVVANVTSWHRGSLDENELTTLVAAGQGSAS